MPKPYIQHPGKVVIADGRFRHVMAIALDATTDYKEGVIRCIIERTGDPCVSGNLDRSQLYRVHARDLDHVELTERIKIKNEREVLDRLSIHNGNKLDFIGLEDPDLFFDEKTDLLHMYFTLPFIDKKPKKDLMYIHLGHAVGLNIDSLEMTEPVIMGDTEDHKRSCAKELSIAPVNKEGVRLNLVESYDNRGGMGYSTVRKAIAKDMGGSWKLDEAVFHPADAGIKWIAGHASPGPLFSTEFLDIGSGRRVGIINGRSETKIIGGKKIYGPFTVGLFIYDYDNGKIDWVSPELFIEDSEARNITFASQFIETGKGEGILYAHVDDSFVRAYTLNAESIRTLLPNI